MKMKNHSSNNIYYRNPSLVIIFLAIFSCILPLSVQQQQCINQCYSSNHDSNCGTDQVGLQSYTLHMSVHPHLDAYWIYNLESYYDPKPAQIDVKSYFRSNRFNSVKEIFNTIIKVLEKSKNYRQVNGKSSQKAHRSFFNSQMVFFKKWYNELDQKTKDTVKDLLKTKYWEIMGGGFIQHDEGCAYYDDIIENFDTGLNFLKTQFNYFPKIAISADSFGHSQSTLAILAHLGVEGYFVERSDEHILLQNKTEFIWKAKSSNGQYYGALPTHIRWAIHGFEDQFIGSNPNSYNMCSSKETFINNIRRENKFLKRILKSNHIMRYFGHDFQQFDEYSYSVIQAIMQKFSSQKCNKVTAVYGNPTEYFMTLMGQVFRKNIKPIATRQQDIMPIWDYDSGLYWTGYYTTDPYHKKDYRNLGRFLSVVRKLMVPYWFLKNGTEDIQTKKIQYETLQKAAQQVAYLQHHDGISGTSKNVIMDELQVENKQFVSKITQETLNPLFALEFQQVKPKQSAHFCFFGEDCKIKAQDATVSQIYLKIFNSAGYHRGSNEPIIVELPFDVYYTPVNCPYQLNCFCQELPCNCSLYMYPIHFQTYLTISLKLSTKPEEKNIKRLSKLPENHEIFSSNSTHFKITLPESKKQYSIGYKRIQAQSTSRRYKHLSRYGDQIQRRFNIKSGKYALGNNPNKITQLSSIHRTLHLQSQRSHFILIKWARQGMKTFITMNKKNMTEWKVVTLSAAEGYKLADLYLEVQTSIKNDQKFYTDSNGWLVMPRKLFHHQDYQAHFESNKCDDVDGNSYPMTAFCYIEDETEKVSINTDRPQGVIAYKPGTLWVNFDRLTADDGKWVYETTHRSEYQKFVHVISVQKPGGNNERKVQALYDMPVFTQVNYLSAEDVLGLNQAVDEEADEKESISQKSKEWKQQSGLNGLKTLIKPLNTSSSSSSSTQSFSLLLRIHNLQDKQFKQVFLFTKDNTSPLLIALYGNKINFTKITERSLGNNMDYEEFLARKWNWNDVINLDQENSIFNKKFGQRITLRPLQIRTFLLEGVKFIEQCVQSPPASSQDGTITYQLDKTKPMPTRQDPFWQRQVTDYMLNKDHCKIKSPIVVVKTQSQKQQAVKVKIEDIVNQNMPFAPKPKTNPSLTTQQATIAKNQRQFSLDEASFQNLKTRVFTQQRLTSQQKQIYFKQKLARIKAQSE